jgi:acetolactate synthase-1/2/3 large subunit
LLSALIRCGKTRNDESALRWRSHNRAQRENWRLEAKADEDSEKLKASCLFRTLHDHLPENTIIVDEIVSHQPAMLRWLFESKSFGHIRGWCGGLGTAIATALGVKLAEPEELVVCVIGDGALQYNPVPACLGFSQQYDVPILILICNNQRYESQTWNVKKYFPHGASVRNNNMMGSVIDPSPDYSKLALAYGGFGERVDQPEQLPDALQRSLGEISKGRFAVLDVLVEA